MKIVKSDSMLDVRKIRIVLVETSHPGNIGATARAMKTMQQDQLYLVNPKIYPSAESTARATGADDVLHKAIVCDDLDEALQDCSMIFATTARDRSIQWPVHNPKSCSDTIMKTSAETNIAIVFGRERSGLSNEEVDRCNQIVQIPANEEYSSLNLASAVQIICYELMMAALDTAVDDDSGSNIPERALDNLTTHQQMEGFYEHLITTMIDVGFYDPEQPKKLIRRVKRLFNRAQLDQTELRILRGFLSATQEKIK